MILFKKTNNLRKYLDNQKEKNYQIGFVPTMGALHEGHLSLIRQAKSQSDLVVCSIFINPTQFNDPEDFLKYPVTTEADIRLLLSAGCDVLFLPSRDEMYPPEASGQPTFYALGELELLLEGKFRPGHFQGVCQVVDRLLFQVQPDILFLGQKDYQQCMVISRLLELTDRNKSISLVVCPTLRETDGLAMSSRNRRLSVTEREKAPAIFHTLCYVRDQLRPGPTGDLLKEAVSALTAAGFRVEYISLADARNLKPCTDWDGQQELVVLCAAFLGEVRLIDNLPLN